MKETIVILQYIDNEKNNQAVKKIIDSISDIHISSG